MSAKVPYHLIGKTLWTEKGKIELNDKMTKEQTEEAAKHHAGISWIEVVEKKPNKRRSEKKEDE